MPNNLVVGDEKYNEFTAQLGKVNDDVMSAKSDLESKLAELHPQRQREEEAVEEWRKQRAALSHAEAEVERLQADVSRLDATKAWLQQGLAKAKKPAKQPDLSSPPRSAGGSAAASSSSLPPSGSVSKEKIKEKLKDLKEFLEQGLIDEDEYKQQKELLMIDFRAAQ